jgi:hypothetical protein
MPTDTPTPERNPWDELPAGEVTVKASKSGEITVYIDGELVDTQHVSGWEGSQ